MPLIGAVADDLTGATTTGVLLARSKARTAVFFNEEAAEREGEAETLDAILVSSNSRALPAEEAYEKVSSATQALKRMGVRYFSKRIDTTLRGGIGTEIKAMMDVVGGDAVAVVVPSMPQSRRIVVGGFSVIDGIALTKTPVAQDVRTPVHESYVPQLLSRQTGEETGLVTLKTVLLGREEIARALKWQRERGNRIIVVDAITLEDFAGLECTGSGPGGIYGKAGILQRADRGRTAQCSGKDTGRHGQNRAGCSRKRHTCDKAAAGNPAGGPASCTGQCGPHPAD